MNTIHYAYRAYQPQVASHSHSHGQIILPLTGSLRIMTETLEAEVHQELIFFLPPGLQHSYFAGPVNEFLVLDVPAHFFAARDLPHQQGGRLIPLDEKWRLVRQLLLKECARNTQSESINHLFRYFYHDLLQGPGQVSLEYIKNHYHRTLPLDFLARMEGYTPSYYSEWFKKHTGVTVTDYIKALRIHRSKELLRDTAYTLIQIAQMVGYAHHSSLTRAFREIEGLSPAEYRRLSRNPAKKLRKDR